MTFQSEAVLSARVFYHPKALPLSRYPDVIEAKAVVDFYSHCHYLQLQISCCIGTMSCHIFNQRGQWMGLRITCYGH